jgi:hypothetical protein
MTCDLAFVIAVPELAGHPEVSWGLDEDVHEHIT